MFRVDTMLCSDTLLAAYAPTSPTDGVLYVGSTLHSWVPSTWSMWALYPGHITRLWALPIPAVSLPAVPVRFSWPDVPKMGPIGLLTTLSTPEQGVMCLDWGIVDTGP